jgi:hypothetical protein
MDKVTVLGSVVIKEGRIRDYRELVNVVCSIVKRKEGTHEDISIKEIVFCPRTNVYVAIYEVPISSRRMTSPSVRGRRVNR